MSTHDSRGIPAPAERSADDFLPDVLSRGRQRRRRRALRLATGSASLLIGVVALMSLAIAGAQSGPERLAVNGTGTTDGAGEEPPPTGSTFVEPGSDGAPTTTAAPDSTSTTTFKATSPTTISTVPPSSTTTVLATCTDEDFRRTLTTDKQSYALGETVRFSATIKNISSRSCASPSLSEWCIFDSGRTGGRCELTKDERTGAGPGLAPGEEARSELQWKEQRGWCDNNPNDGCDEVSPGEYGAAVTWSEFGSTSVTFTIRDASS